MGVATFKLGLGMTFFGRHSQNVPENVSQGTREDNWPASLQFWVRLLLQALMKRFEMIWGSCACAGYAFVCEQNM